MAVIKIATLINHVLVDQDYVAQAALAGDDLVVRVENAFINAAPVDLPVDTLLPAYQTAVYDTIDAATLQNVPDGSAIIRTQFNGTTYTMGGYVRSGIGSTGDPITAVHEVLLVFTIAWLSAPTGVLELPLTLQTGVALDSAEVAALLDKGITVSGTGDTVTVASDVPYRLITVQPVLPAYNYVIINEYDTQTVY